MAHEMVLERVVNRNQRDSLHRQLRPILESCPLPQFPPELVYGGFEEYSRAKSSVIASALRFMSSELQPSLAQVFANELSFLVSDATLLSERKIWSIHISGLTEVEEIPPTPYRGTLSMKQVFIPHRAYLMDLAILALLHLASQASSFVQSNIDPICNDQTAPALNFHIDRGAEITAIGALRGCGGKFTHLTSWAAVATSCESNAFQTLFEERFRPVDRRSCKSDFSILCRDGTEKVFLNPEIVNNKLELTDLEGQDNDSGAQRALQSLFAALAFENQMLDSSIWRSDLDPMARWRCCLKSGDILVVNNLSVLHGRSAGRCSDPKMNRWLRVAFGERLVGAHLYAGDLPCDGHLTKELCKWNDALLRTMD